MNDQLALSKHTYMSEAAHPPAPTWEDPVETRIPAVWPGILFREDEVVATKAIALPWMGGMPGAFVVASLLPLAGMSTSILARDASGWNQPTIVASVPGFSQNTTIDRLSGVESGRSTKRVRLSKRIEQFGAREIGWDGDNGAPPSKDAIDDSLAFLDALTPDYPLPEAVYSAGDGEIAFQWRRRDGSFIEVGFYGDGTISWYAKLGANAPQHRDSEFTRHAVSSIDRELVQALKALS